MSQAQKNRVVDLAAIATRRWDCYRDLNGRWHWVYTDSDGSVIRVSPQNYRHLLGFATGANTINPARLPVRAR
jgi:hypothetical protein